MAQQLLWIEIVLRLIAGVILLILPLVAARVLGLPLPQATLWPRLIGGLMIGMAGAVFLEGSAMSSRGLGLGGLVIINLATAATLAALLVLERASQTKRGRIFLWSLVVSLVGFSLLELPFV
ncbi:hypothetical protein ACO2I3_13260 [Leptospira interrogans]